MKMSMQKFPQATIDSPKSVKEAEARVDREDREAACRAKGLPPHPLPTGQFGDGRPATGKPINERRHIDQIFGTDARIIEGVAIEQGSGALEVEQQLAEHVLRIQREDGDPAAWIIRDRLLVAKGVNRDKLEDELVARNLLAPDQKKEATAEVKTTTAAVEHLADFQPSGVPN
jgi:hypothetical protein